jgi:ribosomal protein S18
MERYRIVQKTDSFVIIDNNTGQTVKSWSTKPFEGEGVTQSRREDNARRHANDWIRSQPAVEAKEAEVLPEGVNKLDSGNYQSTKTGKIYSTLDELNTAETEFDRVSGLEENVAEFEERITEAGKLREELAENKSARQQGQLMSQLQRAILGTGGDQSQVEAIVPQIQEGGQRSLVDYITGSKAKTQEQLAQFIPGQIGAEYNQQQLSDAMRKFLTGEETDRAQFQATLDAQPEWWEAALSQFAGGLGQGAGQAGTAALLSASDRRVKENISQVGSLDNGLPVYLFNYKGGNTPQIGLMAQDVEKVNKKAVVEINGIKMVNYDWAVK